MVAGPPKGFLGLEARHVGALLAADEGLPIRTHLGVLSGGVIRDVRGPQINTRKGRGWPARAGGGHTSQAGKALGRGARAVPAGRHLESGGQLQLCSRVMQIGY